MDLNKGEVVSRAYRIKVSETLRRHVRVEDGVQTKLELLGILPSERMAELLEAELVARGFKREGDVLVRVCEEDGVQIQIDPSDGTVTVQLAQEEEIALQRERTASVVDAETGKARLSASVRASLEREADHRREEIQEQVTKRLEKAFADAQQELDEVVNRVTADALKERAGQLGEIKEIHEDGESGSITIRVKV